MRSQRSVKVLTYLLCLAFVACSGTYTQKVDYNTLEPLRVAVLPFAEVDKQGHFMEANSSLLIDKVSVVSQSLGELPRSLVRKIVQSELDNTALDILAPSLVNSKLLHAGFSDVELNFNYNRIFTTDAKEFCTQVFDCDAVLFGKVTHWDRSYYGIQSSTTVGVEVQLVSARDGKIIFNGSALDSDSRGISKVPTGFSDLVIEPIKGLDNDNTIKLAERVVKKLLQPLYTKNRPEYLASVPPAIYAAAHSGYNPEDIRQRGVTVVMLGAPKKVATFSIGKTIANIPMVERSSGHYTGTYLPLAEDHFQDQFITVSLLDEFGRATTQNLTGSVSLR